jgi:diacylglycerol kinase (ATP)
MKIIQRKLHKYREAFKAMYQTVMNEGNIKTHIVLWFVGSFLAYQTGELWFVRQTFFLGFAVVILEFINTVFEDVCDFMEPEWNEQIKHIKDLSAGIVILVGWVAVILTVEDLLDIYDVWGRFL